MAPRFRFKSHPSLANLNPLLTIEATTKHPVFRYTGRTATVARWAPDDYGKPLSLAGAGTDPVVNCYTPLRGPQDWAVNFKNADTYQAPNNYYANLTTQDFVLELVAYVDVSTAAARDINYVRKVDGVTGWRVYLASGTDDLYGAFNDGGAFSTALADNISTGWYHILVIYEFNGAVTCYLNGSRQNSVDNTGVSTMTCTTVPLEIGHQVEGPIAYAALWAADGWFAESIQDTVASTRFNDLVGTSPYRADGTAQPTANSRDSVSWVHNVTRSGSPTVQKVGKNWPTIGAYKASDGEVVTGLQQWQASENKCLQSSSPGTNPFTVNGTCTGAANTTEVTDPTQWSYTAAKVTGVGNSSNNLTQTIGVVLPGATVAFGLWIYRISTDKTLTIVNDQGASYGKWIVDMSGLPDYWVRLTHGSSYVTVINPFKEASSGGFGFSIYQENYSADASFYLWNVQIEYHVGLEVTGDMGPTTTAAVTRAQQTLTYAMDDGNLGTSGSLQRGTVESMIYSPYVRRSTVPSVGNLELAVTINSLVGTNVFRYKGGDATVADWPTWGAGQAMTIGSGGVGDTDPTVNYGSPLLGTDDDSVLFTAGKVYRGPDAAYMDLTTEDTFTRVVFMVPSSISANQYIWAKGNNYIFINTSFKITFVYTGAGGSLTITYNTVLSPNTWYLYDTFYDASETSNTNGFQSYLNSLNNSTWGGTAANPAAAGTLTNVSIFTIGSSTSYTGKATSALAFAQVVKRSAWFAGGAQNLTDWAAYHNEGLYRMCGVFPQLAAGTQAPTSYSRASSATLRKYDGSTTTYYQVGAGWPRTARILDDNGDTATGQQWGPAITNFALQSSDLNSWSKTNCTTPSSVDGPMKGYPAYAFVESVDGGGGVAHYVISPVLSILDTVSKKLWAYLIIAAGDRPEIRFIPTLAGTTFSSYTIDITAETLTWVSGAVVEESHFETLGVFGGKTFKRIGLQFTSDRVAGNARFYIYSSVAGNYAYQGNGSTCFYLAHAQLELCPSTQSAYLWFKFDGTSGATISDSSGNARHQTLTGSNTNFWTAGRDGNAGYFDKNIPNYISLPIAYFDGTQGTWACWVKSDWTGTSTSDGRFFCATHTSGSNYNHRTYVSGSQLYWYAANGTTATASPLGNLSAYDNQWVHVAWTWKYDGSVNTALRGYLNGVNVSGSNKTIAGPLTSPNLTFEIGRYAAGGAFTGYLDDLVFYQQQLKDDDMLLLYQLGALRSFSAFTSPVVTTTASATRSIEDLYYKGDDGNLGTIATKKEGVIRLLLLQRDIAPDGTGDFLRINDGGASADEIRITYAATTGYVGAIFTATGGTVRTITGPAVNVFDNAPHEVELVFSAIVSTAYLTVDGARGTVASTLLPADVPDDLDRIYPTAELLADHQIKPYNPTPYFSIDPATYVPSVGNLSSQIVVNGTAGTNVFRYKGGDATLATWPAWGVGDTLNIQSGTDPTLNYGSPLLGTYDDSVKLNAGKSYQIPADTAYANITNEDFIIEGLIYPVSAAGTTYIIVKYASAKGYVIQLNSSGTLITCAVGDGADSISTTGTVVANTWVHLVWAVDRSASQRVWINAIVTDTDSLATVDSADIGNAAKFTIGSWPGLTSPTNSAIAYLHMAKRLNWFTVDGVDNTVDTWVSNRFAQLTGVWPQLARGTPTPTFTRANAAFLRKNDGTNTQYWYVGAGWPRSDKIKDAASAFFTGAQMESSGTNYALRSCDMNNWNKTLCTTPSSITSPLSGQVAYAFVESTDGSPQAHYVYGPNCSLGDTTGQRCWAYLIIAAGDESAVRCLFRAGGNILVTNAQLNLNDGTISYVAGQALQSTYVSTIGTFGGKLFKLFAWSFISDKGAGNSSYLIYSMSGGTNSYQGDGTTCFYLAHAQIEIGSSLPCYSSPIITTTASVTREADVLYYKADDGNIGGVGSDRAGTIQLKLHKASYTPAANQSLYTLNDGGSTADQIKIYTDSNGYVQAQFDATGGTQRTVAGPSTSVFNNLPHQVSLTYRVGYAVLYLDGVAGTVNTALVQADIPINLDRLYYNTGLIAHHQFLPDTPQDRYAYSISNGNASTDAITAQVPGYRESFRQGPNARDVLRYSVNSTTTGYRDTPGAKNVADDDKHQSRVWWRSGAFRQATDTGDNDSGDASTTAPTGLTQLSLTGDPRSSLPSNTLINDVRIWDHALSNTAGSGQRAATNSFTLASTAKVNEGITHMEDSGGGSRFKAVFAEGRHAVDDAYVLLNGNTPYI